MDYEALKARAEWHGREANLWFLILIILGFVSVGFAVAWGVTGKSVYLFLHVIDMGGCLIANFQAAKHRVISKDALIRSGRALYL
jgi:hypothetical protein